MERNEKEDLVLRLLRHSTDELITLYPALGAALALLPVRLTEESEPYTDGEAFYAPLSLLRVYADDPRALRRGLLHTLLHCLYAHLFPPDGIDMAFWDLAADMIAERQIDELCESRLGRASSPLREQMTALFPSPLPPPEILVRALKSARLPAPLGELQKVFAFDRHAVPADSAGEFRRRWAEALSFVSANGSGAGRRGSSAGQEAEEVIDIDSAPFDYRRYLRRFTVPREEIETDPESFDYIPYCLGLEIYGDMPLVEPLEYREVWRLDELVIAIDTSGSCSAELVSCFLRETYAVLSDQENFFRRMNVVFMQCDCCLQDCAVIRSREEWERYAANIRILGRGGTIFTPVFDEIDRLRKAGTLKKPKALLYFTDGDGVYPTYPPDYEVIFVMKGDTMRPDLVPKWIRVLRLP